MNVYQTTFKINDVKCSELFNRFICEQNKQLTTANCVVIIILINTVGYKHTNMITSPGWNFTESTLVVYIFVILFNLVTIFLS